MNYKMIRYIIGMILMAESAFMVLPMLVSVFYKEYDVLMPFVYSIFASSSSRLRALISAGAISKMLWQPVLPRLRIFIAALAQATITEEVN